MHMEQKFSEPYEYRVLSLYDITYMYRLIKTKTVIIILRVHCERASIECFE